MFASFSLPTPKISDHMLISCLGKVFAAYPVCSFFSNNTFAKSIFSGMPLQRKVFSSSPFLVLQGGQTRPLSGLDRVEAYAKRSPVKCRMGIAIFELFP